MNNDIGEAVTFPVNQTQVANDGSRDVNTRRLSTVWQILKFLRG